MEKVAELKRVHKGLINMMPLQTGGILTDAAREALQEFADGYSVCDFCTGDLCQITTPPIRRFVYEELPEFLGADVATITYGARDGKFMVMHSMAQPGDKIIVDGNKHYSTVVAAERAGMKVVQVPNSGYPEYKINVEDYIPLIKEHKPKLLLLTYPDGNLGNLPDARRLAEIAKEYEVPYILNGAYAIGRFPIRLDEIGADFIIGSGHKSMAAAAPSGVVGMVKKWEPVVMRRSPIYKKKYVELLGCSLRGATLATLMASFPYVKERIKDWDEQVKKAQWFSGELEKLGFLQQGEKPHRHDLMNIEALRLYEISLKVRERGYMVYKELKERGIFGPQPGLAKHFKLSTYAATEEQLRQVLDAFKDILNKYA